MKDTISLTHPKKNQKELVITWTEYIDLIENLISQIPKDKYSCVYGIARGGSIPATIISYRMNLPCLSNYREIEKFTDYGLKFCLVVDDISDSGKTLNIFQNYKNIETATVFFKEGSANKPDYFAKLLSSDVWVVFPYDAK